MSRSKRITIAVLLLLTLLLAGISTYVTLTTLQEDTAPDDSGAESSGSGGNCVDLGDRLVCTIADASCLKNNSNPFVSAFQCDTAQLPCRSQDGVLNRTYDESTQTMTLFKRDCGAMQVDIGCSQGGVITYVEYNTGVDCTDDTTPPPTEPPPSTTLERPRVTSTCPAGSTSPRATITWTNPNNVETQGYWIDIDNDTNFDNGFWNKWIPSPDTLTTNAPNGFNPFNGATGALVLNSLDAYNVRVYYPTLGRHSEVRRFRAAECITTTDLVCGQSGCTADADCTDSSVCDETDGICKLQECIDNPASCQDECTPNDAGRITGAAYCQDGSGTRYNIPNAIITLDYGAGTPVQILTDANGNYTINNVIASDDFGVTAAIPTGDLPTGQPYSAMTGPTAVNCSDGSVTGCTGGTGNYCGTGNASYAQCAIDNTTHNGFDFRYENCTPAPEGCVDLVEFGPDPIDAGVGNTIVYRLRYRNYSTTNPYPSIALRVGPAGSEVGRDFNNNTSDIVVPAEAATYDSSTGIWTYIFVWEAAEVGGTATADGTYDVRVMLDGTDTTTIATASCQEDITVTDGVDQEAAFVLVKSSASVCEADGDQRIDYTITATNVGPVDGVIDFVSDTYDADLATYGISPTNITPSFGTDTGSAIQWVGTLADRTFTAGQSKNYTYSITIPRSVLINFQGGVENSVTLEYTTTDTNTVTFDMRTELECSLPSIPTTGLLDDARYLLIGFMFMIIAIYVLIKGTGSKQMETLFSWLSENTSDRLVNLAPFEKQADRNLRKKLRKK